MKFLEKISEAMSKKNSLLEGYLSIIKEHK
jgi:hypothetical protein